MFNSDNEDGMGLLSQNHITDEKIDLSNIEAVEAFAIIESAIIKHKAQASQKIWFYFPLASGDGPTLFAPIGNLLRDKLKKGEIIRAMPAQSGGWIVRL